MIYRRSIYTYIVFTRLQYICSLERCYSGLDHDKIEWISGQTLHTVWVGCEIAFRVCIAVYCVIVVGLAGLVGLALGERKVKKIEKDLFSSGYFGPDTPDLLE